MPLLNRLLRAGETKLVKRLARSPTHIDTLEPDVQDLTDARAAGEDRRVPHALRRRRDLDDLLPEAFAVVREAAKRTSASGTSRAADGRRGAAPGQHRRDEDRRGQDPHLGAAGVPQRARRQGRAHGHRQRLPGPARRGEDGPDPPLPRPDRRRDPVRDAAGRPARRSTPPTSPTARTTSSASTTCATTWPGTKADLVQRGHNFAIVDEADSILIDEARTPLIISGPAEQSARWYQEFARMAPDAQARRPLRGRRAQAHRRGHRGGRRAGRGPARASTTSTRPRTPRWSGT